tara:strand:- start:2391 stop:2747 length:357 start_codon:yes stop_codon:yes gene_type:complete
MPIKHKSLQATSKKLLDKFGKFGYIKLSKSSGDYDPVTGEKLGTESTHDLYAVDLNISKELVDGTLIFGSDRMVIMSSDIEPEMGDDIIIGTRQLEIIAIMPLSPGGDDVFYKVVCRG